MEKKTLSASLFRTPRPASKRSEHVQLEFVKNGRRVEKSISVELRSKNRERGGEKFERVGE